MGFNDIFKSSFLENIGSVSLLDMGIALGLAFCLGLFIFMVYRKTFNGVMYSSSFGVTLIALTMITTVVILAVTSNVVLSLGMVGALSIVRFRTAIKDPMDLMFLFWSIAVGIICGVGLAEIAVLLSLFLTVGVFVLNHLPVAKAPQILVVNTTDLKSEKQILEAVKPFASSYSVKSRNMSRASLDLIIELRTAEGCELVQRLLELEAVTSASLMAHDGEVTF